MAKFLSSFDRLKITPQLENSRIAKYLNNPRLTLLVILLISIVGIYSFSNIPRVLNPSINIAIVNVLTVLPGAGPDDVEGLVTIPLEDAVNGLTSVKTVTSSSRDSISVISIEFESGTDPEKARTDTQAAVDSVTLPTDAQTPKVSKLDFQNQPVWSFTVTTKEDNATLVRFSKELKERIKDLPEVKDVTTTGVDEQEIQIILKPESITTYGLNPQAILGAIKSSVSALPAGPVRTEGSIFTLTIDPQVTDIADLRNLKVNVGGEVVSLSDVAQVVLRSKPDQNSSYFASADTPALRSVNFNVFKTSSAQIENTARKAETRVDEVLNDNANRFEIHNNLNSADFITDQFNELTRDFAITIALVFATLLIFLGLRQAIVSSFSIPLTFFMTFTVMQIFNIDFSFIAFFSLLLSLGLLVDDTIVVISAITLYYRVGKFSALQVGILVWRDFLVAVFTTTLTTVWAFVPLLLSSGIIGEFIKPIPIVVSSTLLGSFFVAMFLTLPIMVIILRPRIPYRVQVLFRILSLVTLFLIFYFLVPKTNLLLLQILVFLILIFVFLNIRQIIFAKFGGLNERLKSKIDNGLISFGPVTRRYHLLISSILASTSARRKAIFAVLVFFIFSMALFPLGFVKNEFFPSSDEDYLYVSLELAPGTSLDVTQKEILNVLEQLRKIPELEFANANLGTSLSMDTGDFSAGGQNSALITLVLSKHTKRNHSSIDIAQEIRDKFSSYDKGKFTVMEVSGGPPAGADLQIKLFGPDLNQLNLYGDQIQEYLKKRDGILTTDKSIKPGTSKITFVPDQTKLSENGVSVDQISFWLRTFASGFNAESIKLLGEKTDTDISIRVNSHTEYSQNISKLMIPAQSGNVPLVSLGTLKLEPNPTLITRENGNRTISVTAGVKKGINVADKNKELEKFADSVNLAPGYSWQTGGVNEENQRSVNSILQAMLLSFLLIIVTMVVQFSSFRDALIVMLVIPLAISGVFIIFALTATPLSFPALIGILALFGIVVKNSILLVDKINQNKDLFRSRSENSITLAQRTLPSADAERKSDALLREVIADATSSRIEPIFLTSFATIIGLIPITLSNPLWRGLGGAIIAGLTFSGIIMLIFIPVVYYLLFRSAGRKRRNSDSFRSDYKKVISLRATSSKNTSFS